MSVNELTAHFKFICIEHRVVRVTFWRITIILNYIYNTTPFSVIEKQSRRGRALEQLEYSGTKTFMNGLIAHNKRSL